MALAYQVSVEEAFALSARFAIRAAYFAARK
jgi:hypothetical protein